jgi:hypothetical protein
MRKNLLILIFALISISAFSQSSQSSETILRLSGGRVNFGSGDILGYGLGIDLSKNVIAKAKPGLNKLMLGAEMLFENGVKNPIVQNPTIGEFFSTSFQHVSTSQLWIKGSYYPFGKIVKGFNIQVGPTVGYSYRSNEARSARRVDVFGNAVRESTLQFDNGFTIGYRISTGLQFDLNHKLQAGFRLDFSNNNEGEINTLAGLSMGLKL